MASRFSAGILILAGVVAPSMPDPTRGAPQSLSLTSSAFRHGEPIPREFTCQGDDVSPPLAWAGVPREARALALVMDDPDAPRGTFTHWTWWDAPADAKSLAKGEPAAKLGAKEGRTDFDATGYGGPCPPTGSHRYFFRLYALREPLGLPAGARVADVWKALDGRVLAWGELMGTYRKE